jgi:hypothetical protein
LGEVRLPLNGTCAWQHGIPQVLLTIVWPQQDDAFCCPHVVGTVLLFREAEKHEWSLTLLSEMMSEPTTHSRTDVAKRLMGRNPSSLYPSICYIEPENKKHLSPGNTVSLNPMDPCIFDMTIAGSAVTGCRDSVETRGQNYIFLLPLSSDSDTPRVPRFDTQEGNRFGEVNRNF